MCRSRLVKHPDLLSKTGCVCVCVKALQVSAHRMHVTLRQFIEDEQNSVSM